MASRQFEIGSVLLIIREMQIKTNNWSEWPSLINLQITNARWGVEKGDPSVLWVGM